VKGLKSLSYRVPGAYRVREYVLGVEMEEKAEEEYGYVESVKGVGTQWYDLHH
jgi:hypothetical protein